MKKNFYYNNVLRSLGVVFLVFLIRVGASAQAVGDYGFVQTTATGGQYLAATINNWVVCVTAGTWTGATTATVAVGGSINAYVRTGTTCALSASQSFKNLTIDAGGSLIAQLGTTSGSPRGVRINGGTLQIDGTMGGTGNSGVDGYLGIEPQSITVTTTTVQGSGTCLISRVRPSASATAGNTIKLNMNMTLITTGQALSTNGAANTTIEVLAGKTVTIPSGYIAVSNNPLVDPATGADNFTVNIYGTVDLQSATQGNINFSNTSTFPMKVNLFKGSVVTVGSKILAPAATATTGAMTLKIEEGASLTATGGYDFAKGSLEYATATTGSTGASIAAIAALTPVKTLTINNTGGVTLSAASTVTGALTMTAGNLTLGANDLTAGSFVGGSASSHVVATSTGLLKSAVGAGAAKTFPVGATTTSYDPATVTPTSGVVFGVGVKPAFTVIPTGDAAKRLDREWEITATGAGSTAVSLTADASLTPPSGTAAIGHNGGSWNETDMTAVSVSGNTYTGTNAAGTFSPFGVGVAGGFVSTPLAVELTHFSAKPNGNTNLLAWKTANEKDNAAFQIERSANGLNFVNIGTVKGNGTKSSASEYTFSDETPLSISYYRLVFEDKNGKKETSNIITVLRGANGKTKLFPTLVADKMTLVSDSNDAQTYNIFDLTGRNVLRGTFTTQQEISVSNLATGTYFLKVDSDVVKFIKQ